MSDNEFLDLIREHKKTIDHMCHKYFRSYNREDLFQEIYFELYRSINKFEKKSKFNTWLYSIARNVCVSMLRKEEKHMFHSQVDELEIVYEDKVSEKIQQSIMFDHIIDSISDGDKEVFAMRMEGYSYKEISEMTGLEEIRLRVLVCRINKMLCVEYSQRKELLN